MNKKELSNKLNCDSPFYLNLYNKRDFKACEARETAAY